MSGATPTVEVCRSTSPPLPIFPMRISDPAARHCRHRCRREREGERYRVIRIQRASPASAPPPRARRALRAIVWCTVFKSMAQTPRSGTACFLTRMLASPRVRCGIAVRYEDYRSPRSKRLYEELLFFLPSAYFSGTDLVSDRRPGKCGHAVRLWRSRARLRSAGIEPTRGADCGRAAGLRPLGLPDPQSRARRQQG